MSVTVPVLRRERELLKSYDFVVALDEVGRGAIAGPVAVGASVVGSAQVRRRVPLGLRDSKLVPERRRAEVADRAQQWVIESSVGWSEATEVDDVGILRALGLAASRALAKVHRFTSEARAIVLLDGNYDYLSPAHTQVMDVVPVVKGDRDCASIAAASVIAKVARDAEMAALHLSYREYGWDRNKGYATAAHRDAIRRLGLSPQHRASWAITPAPALF